VTFLRLRVRNYYLYFRSLRLATPPRRKVYREAWDPHEHVRNLNCQKAIFRSGAAPVNGFRAEHYSIAYCCRSVNTRLVDQPGLRADRKYNEVASRINPLKAGICGQSPARSADCRGSGRLPRSGGLPRVRLVVAVRPATAGVGAGRT
jgi:hypothetical protein